MTSKLEWHQDKLMTSVIVQLPSQMKLYYSRLNSMKLSEPMKSINKLGSSLPDN